jgi:hypothetical protein
MLNANDVWWNPVNWPFLAWFAIAFYLVFSWSEFRERYWQYRAKNWPELRALVDTPDIEEYSRGRNGTGYRVKFSYVYSTEGIRAAGQGKREFASRRLADHFLENITNQTIPIRINPRDGQHSVIRRNELDNYLRTLPAKPKPEVIKPLPRWARVLLVPYLFVAIAALVLSIYIHLSAYFGRIVFSDHFFEIFGCSVILAFPAGFVYSRRFVDSDSTSMFERLPKPLRLLNWLIGAYVVINFVLMWFRGLVSLGEGQHEFTSWMMRGFSGHLFYFSYFTVVMVAQTLFATSREYSCVRGHIAADPRDTFCVKCGSPVQAIDDESNGEYDLRS